MSWCFWKRTPQPQVSTLTVSFTTTYADVKIVPAKTNTVVESDAVTESIARVAVLLAGGHMTPYIQQGISESGLSRPRIAHILNLLHNALVHGGPPAEEPRRDAVCPTRVFATNQS